MGDDDEQTSSTGGRMLRVGKRKDGPNWFMIAGGAVVMAVSVAFGRKRILSQGENTKEKTPNAGATTQAVPPHEDDDTGSVHSYATVLHNGTPYWDKSESSAVASQAELLESHSFKTKRPALTDPSPAVSKFSRQLSHNSVCQSNKGPVQLSDSHTTSTALQAGPEMVHRLREQIRSRDAMIYDMQTQLSDQDQMITMHRNHSVDLQQCVQAISTKLFEANLEVQKLHRELIAKPVAGLDKECIDIAIAEIQRQWVHPKDVQDLILEARKLNEEVERLEREKEAKEGLAQAQSRECELLCKKVSALAAELEEVKTGAHGKQRLLELKEQENLKLANVLQNLQHKFEIEERGNEWARSNKLSRRSDIRNNTQSSWKMNHDADRPATPTNCEEVSSTENLRDSHRSVHVRNDMQQDAEDSVVKAESRCVSDAHTKRCEEPADQDGGRLNDDYESLVLKFGHEVDQIASALSVTSKLVSEKMQIASQILMDFQEHIDSRTGAQPNRSMAQSGPQAWKRVDVPQVFSCLSEGMSAEQRQEMRNEIEQVAKQQDVEREMKLLTKHQTNIGELKSVMAKVTARFHAQASGDATSNMEVLQVASSLFDIEQKLAVQEEIAKETSSIIQQLTTLSELSSPHKNPPVQEIWRTVKETSRNPTSVSEQHQKHFIRSSDEKSRNTLQKLDEQNSSRTLERQNSFSASRHFSPNKINNVERQPMKLLDNNNPYQFQLGASSGPISRPRGTRNSTPAAGRTSSRKPPANLHHENTVMGSKTRQPICVVGESPSEATSGFSFGLSARDRPLDDVGTTSGKRYNSQTAESGQLEAIMKTAQPYNEQGDRMSSPEPEPSTTHMYTFSSLHTSEPSVGNYATSFSKRFRSDSVYMQSPAYDDRYSRFGTSPQSPCFGVTMDETTSSRRVVPFLITKTSSSPLAACSNSERLDSDRGFQIKRPTEENSARSGYNSNPDCSPSGPVGVSPFAARLACLDVRQPDSLVGSLCNFEIHNERDHHFACQDDEDEDKDEDDEDVTNLAEDEQFNSCSRDLESLCHSLSNLDTRDSSGSCNNPDQETLTFLPNFLR